MNYDDYLTNERELFEGGEPYDKVYVVLDITNRACDEFESQEEAHTAYLLAGVEYPDCAFNVGWVSEKDVCSDFDYMSSSKVFNPLF